MSGLPAELFSELTTEPTKIEIVTATHQMVGYIFLPRAMKENRRLTNLLNGDKRFIALTKVAVTDRLTGHKESKIYPFVQININSIELVKPIEENS